MRVVKLSFTTAALALLAGCNHSQPGIEVRTVEVVKEVQAPCPGTVPDRPAPLGPLKPSVEAALAQALAKLAEYSAAGQFADQAFAYFEACPPAETPAD